MPQSCNVSVNLNNLQGAIGTNVSTILNLELVTPAGLAALASSIGGTFSEIGSSTANSIEDIIPDISWSAST
jgi:hypothetical protein